ncbi:hypothetical protein A0H81_04842 [Grifola frondosa]|uniref:Uncharacterized protein n=1 Tax=Grifola frondosa TaxID=5627 RepID=A0A1C7MFA3_GRIFR|nr:hypothetical protein A0H81_04842 [Grifola frondosa]
MKRSTCISKPVDAAVSRYPFSPNINVLVPMFTFFIDGPRCPYISRFLPSISDWTEQTPGNIVSGEINKGDAADFNTINMANIVPNLLYIYFLNIHDWLHDDTC